MDTNEYPIIRKQLYNKTSRRAEEMLRDFIKESKVEYTVEESESGRAYVLHVDKERQQDVRIRIWNFRAESPTRIFSLPILMPEHIRKEHRTLSRMYALDIDKGNGKEILLSSAHNIERDIIEPFDRTLAFLRDLIEHGHIKV